MTDVEIGAGEVQIFHDGDYKVYSVQNIRDEDAYVITFDKDGRDDPDKVVKTHFRKLSKGVVDGTHIMVIGSGGNGTILRFVELTE